MNDQTNRRKLIDKLKHWHLTNTEHRVTWLPEHFVAEAIEALSQPPADQWIPVSERLPKQYERVLVTATVMQTAFLKEPKVAVDVGYLIDEWEKAFILSAAGTRQYVKAWMPLPEPFKGE